MRFLDRIQPLALLVVRVVVGVILIAHGTGKVYGGFDKHMEFVASLGLPGWLAYLSAGTEFVGGILLIIGFLVRLVGLALCIEMCVAVLKVHLKQGLIGGYEFPLTLAAIGFLFIWFGAGSIAVDSLYGRRHGATTRRA